MIKKQTIFSAAFGSLVGLTLSMFCVSATLYAEHLETEYYIGLPACACAGLIATIFCLVEAREMIGHNLKAVISGATFCVLVIVTTGYFNHRAFVNDDITSDPNYKASVIATAAAHHYPAPTQMHGWLYWYVSLLPSPFGVGSHYYSIPGPNGSCVVVRNKSYLPFQRESLYAVRPDKLVTDAAAWEQGTMIHELGHCLDANADVEGANFQQWTSLPPYLKSERVETIRDALSAKRFDITLWREAVADIQQVGFWRLTENSARAHVLTEELIDGRKSRAIGSNRDITHATQCWLESLMGRPGPANLSDLFAWADLARREAYATKSTGCEATLLAASRNKMK